MVFVGVAEGGLKGFLPSVPPGPYVVLSLGKELALF